MTERQKRLRDQIRRWRENGGPEKLRLKMKTPEYLAELAYNSALIEGQKLDLERLTEEFRKLLAERR